MAIRHAASGEIVSVRPPGAPLDDSQSTTLLREGQLKVTRLFVPAGMRCPDQPGFP